MIVNNEQFIQLTNDHPCSISNGQPLYINSKKICVICPKTDVNGNEKGSYIYLDGCTDENVLRAKESPEDIIGLINDETFCAFSNKFPCDQIPYPEK